MFDAVYLSHIKNELKVPKSELGDRVKSFELKYSCKIWAEKSSDCTNLKSVHVIGQSYNAMVRHLGSDQSNYPLLQEF